MEKTKLDFNSEEAKLIANKYRDKIVSLSLRAYSKYDTETQVVGGGCLLMSALVVYAISLQSKDLVRQLTLLESFHEKMKNSIIKRFIDEIDGKDKKMGHVCNHDPV